MTKIQKHIILLAAILQWLGISVFAGEVHEIHFLKDSYASGERTVKSSGDNAAMFVNAEFAGGMTNTAKFSLYVSPYLVANQGGRYTRHIYIGSQRIVSKLGDLKSYGADPRRIEYAGSESDGPKVDYKTKYAQQQQVIKDNFAHFDVPYNGADNNDYVDGKGFSERDGSLKDAMLKAASLKDNFQQGDSYEKYQYFYHPDHLGSSSFITNTEGEVVQHIEYVPYGEVFIEERNNVWNTPYLFNAKEFDEETGLYYYGARYYDARLAMWYGVDALAEEYPNMGGYVYCANNPIRLIDPDGNDWYMTSNDDISTPVYFEGHNEHDGYTNIGESVLAMSEDGVQRSFNSDGTVTESVMLNDVVVESKYNNYRKGTFSYNESYLNYVPYEGVGINGSTSVRGFAKVYEMNGNMRAFVSADAFAPIENMGDVVYSGNVSIDVNGKTINSVGLRPATGSYFSQTGRTLVGVNDFALPQTDGDVTLKFNVMYTFSDGTGHIPSRLFEHKLQVGFTKP